MRIGIVCPYSMDVMGGVQIHALDLAKHLISQGNYVRILAPAGADDNLPDFVDSAGKAVAIPYNGSVARLKFSPVAYYKLKKWIEVNNFEVLHIHEPTAPSISLLALFKVKGPMVVTFHMANDKSKALQIFKTPIKPFLEKVSGKIAVSDYARKLQIEAFGSNSIVIPNGVEVEYYAQAKPMVEINKTKKRILFIGRYNEPRKGFSLLLSAFNTLKQKYSELELVVIGAGDKAEFTKVELEGVKFLGQVTNAEKASWLKTADVYCAPNNSGESFGIILVEALSAGIPVVASDLPAFKAVLAEGKAGILFSNNNLNSLATALEAALFDKTLTTGLSDKGWDFVQRFDWDRVTRQILEVYKMAIFSSESDTVTISD